MKEEEITEMEKILIPKIKEDAKENKRLKRIEAISELIPSPKGIFKKHCPRCTGNLKHKTICDRFGNIFEVFQCICGYEYVIRPFKSFVRDDPLYEKYNEENSN